MRLNPSQITEITGRKQPKRQTAWFLDYLGINVPADKRGPILTESLIETLLARAIGLTGSSDISTNKPKPQIRMKEPSKQ